MILFVSLHILQAHSNIGYVMALTLNLSLLLPLADNPKVGNYTIVLQVSFPPTEMESATDGPSLL